jgi:BirA family transcriptional regulator, biotin operon repressor / biotin---[acetyl-CoA-carboxylase] ligase
MDLAHQLAADGAVHGTVVVADVQDSGRGRNGRTWVSERGAGVWASVLLRQQTDTAAGVVSLRVGMQLAAALEQLVPAVRIGVKWPNDLMIGAGKVAGVLAEARWRGVALEWIVVGVGVNIAMPPHAASIAPGSRSAALGGQVSRADVLVSTVRAVLAAAKRAGDLDDAERSAFAARDIAVGRRIRAPIEGTAIGISAGGGLCVRVASGGEVVAVAGSLEFQALEKE